MIFVSGVKNPEGPVLLPDGNWVLVEMHPERGCVTWISKDGKQRRTVAKTGRPNGVTIDKNSVLWIAESMNPPSLLRMTLDGKYEVILKDCNGEPFLFPNDLRFGPDGALYMTDSGILFKDWSGLDSDKRKGTKTDGRVFKIDVKTRKIEKLDSGIPFANGIAFGPDNNLYVNATQNGMVYKYQWKNGRVGKREDFGNVINPALGPGFRGPDGMAWGLDGLLYCTVSRQGDVTVLDQKGKVVRRIQLDGPSPTNIAFGPKGSKKIYVTEQGTGQFEVHDVTTDGLPLYKG
jgi:gluconolactonase